MKNLVDKLIQGELVAVPTETVYGLAANALDEQAVKNIYEIKGRPEIKPLSIMVHDSTWIKRFCKDIPDAAYYLADKFWPGPLTIVLNSNDVIPSIVRANGHTIGLRCPDNDLTLKLIDEANVPLAAPSANPSGKTSAKSAKEVYEYFGDSVNILDGGECSIGKESTIISLASYPYKILRQGALKEEEIIDSLFECSSIIGITGQSGTGKSYICDCYAENGYKIIDCDALYHELLETSSEMIEDIKYMFDDAFDGDVLNRKKLANIVFNNSDDLETLNKITHFYILKKVKELIRELILNGNTKFIIEAIELISSGLADLCDKTIAVVADKEIQINRIMKRDNLTYDEAQMRIDAQKDNSYFIDRCDTVITNNGNDLNLTNLDTRDLK